MGASLVIKTNPYLKDLQQVARGICRMVKSSSAVEGIYVDVSATHKKDGYQFSVTPRSPQKK